MRLPLIILAVLFCSGGAVALAGGNHCSSIHEVKTDCDKVGDDKVQRKCMELQATEYDAGESQKESCGKEAVASEQKGGCLMTASNQKDIDGCNAASDSDLKKTAQEAADSAKSSKKEIRKLRKELEEEIQAVKRDKNRDQSGISEAENAAQEGNQIEKDVATAAADNQQAANQFGGNSNTGMDRAGGLGSVPNSGPASGTPSAASPTGAGASVASSTPDAGTSAASAAAPAAQSAAQALTNSPQGGGGGTPAGEQATAPTPPTQGNAAPVEGGGPITETGNGSPTNLAQAGSGSGSAHTGAASSATPSATPGTSPALPSTNVAIAPSEAPASGGVDSSLRASLRARLENSSGSSSMGGAGYSTSSGGAASGGGTGVAIGGGGRGLASAHGSASGGADVEVVKSEDKPEVVAGGQEELHAFTSSLGHPEISLMGSETDASVRRIMGDFADDKSTPKIQTAPDEDIGDKNGPTLFARSHAVYERALRRGIVRGVAIR